jgi:hypothetical protein
MERKVLFEDIEMNKIPDQNRLEKTHKKLLKLASSSEDWELMHENEGIKVWFKDAPVLSISEERMCCMKGELIVSSSPQAVYDVVKNLKRRLEWDSLLTTANIVEQMDDDRTILHTYWKATGGTKPINIDFCILQCIHPPVQGDKEETYLVISERSIKYPKVPKRDDCVRGQVFAPSGFVIFNESGNGEPKTHVVYTIRQLGNEALGASLVTQWEVFIESLLRLRKILE